VTDEIGRDEAIEFGHEGGGSDDDEDGRAQARLVDEDEEIDSGDDEEIDSDAAFEESDDDRFAGFNFASSQKVSLAFEKIYEGSRAHIGRNCRSQKNLSSSPNLSKRLGFALRMLI